MTKRSPWSQRLDLMIHWYSIYCQLSNNKGNASKNLPMAQCTIYSASKIKSIQYHSLNHQKNQKSMLKTGEQIDATCLSIYYRLLNDFKLNKTANFDYRIPFNSSKKDPSIDLNSLNYWLLTSKEWKQNRKSDQRGREKKTLFACRTNWEWAKWKFNIWISMELDDGKTMWIWDEKMKVHGLCSMLIHHTRKKIEMWIKQQDKAQELLLLIVRCGIKKENWAASSLQLMLRLETYTISISHFVYPCDRNRRKKNWREIECE